MTDFELMGAALEEARKAYNTIGGVQADIHPEFVKKVKELIKYLRPVLKEYHEIFTGNVIAQQRLKGTGVLTREDAVSFGATGGTGRAPAEEVPEQTRGTILLVESNAEVARYVADHFKARYSVEASKCFFM